MHIFRVQWRVIVFTVPGIISRSCKTVCKYIYYTNTTCNAVTVYTQDAFDERPRQKQPGAKITDAHTHTNTILLGGGEKECGGASRQAPEIYFNVN